MSLRGKLQVGANDLLVSYHDGRRTRFERVTAAQLSRKLTELAQSSRSSLDGHPVDLEDENGQPRRVRSRGEQWEPPVVVKTPAPARPGPSVAAGPPTRRADRTPSVPARGQGPALFHNPYNFIPAPPRDGYQGGLEDGAPMGHDAYHRDRWSGWLDVDMEAKTPLLIPDVPVDPTAAHKVYPVRLGVDGRPYLPPTTVKGMLRSAYEAVTNSRFGVFEDHALRLGFRRSQDDARALVPARVVEAGERPSVQLLTGTVGRRWDGTPVPVEGRGLVLYAAWLPLDSARVRYVSGRPVHGEEVTCRVGLLKHREGHFSFWQVGSLGTGRAVPESELPPMPEGLQSAALEERVITGWAYVTGKTISRKHDDRVFFVNGSAKAAALRCQPGVGERWTALVEQYQDLHKEELEARKREGQSPIEYLGPKSGEPGWSPHVYNDDWLVLRPGSLCYAQVERDQVTALYPVQISRDLFAQPPSELLHASLHPAASIDQLSPADRVFGWAHRNGAGAWRGSLRVGQTRCQGDDNPVVSFGTDGISLAILGQPKPQQARFYVGKVGGEPLAGPNTSAPLGISTYSTCAGNALRGRKVYPHHRGLPPGYWDPEAQPTAPRRWREYLQAGRTPDKQNRSVLGWVQPGVHFAVRLQVTNLSDVELGALLWLLQLPPDHYHRLGGGKPLGFGSVAVRVLNVDIADGIALASDYLSLGNGADGGRRISTVGAEVAELVATYQAAVSTSEHSSFEAVSFIRAFYRTTHGHGDDHPTHYPRQTVEPDAKGENYKWFVANAGRHGRKVVLPALVADTGLPCDAEAPQESPGSGPRSRR